MRNDKPSASGRRTFLRGGAAAVGITATGLGATAVARPQATPVSSFAVGRPVLGEPLPDAGGGRFDDGGIGGIGNHGVDRLVEIVGVLRKQAHDSPPSRGRSSCWSRCRARCRITAIEVWEAPILRAISRFPTPSK